MYCTVLYCTVWQYLDLIGRDRCRGNYGVGEYCIWEVGRTEGGKDLEDGTEGDELIKGIYVCRLGKYVLCR